MPLLIGPIALFIGLVLMAIVITRFVVRDRLIRQMRAATERRAQQIRDRYRIGDEHLARDPVDPA